VSGCKVCRSDGSAWVDDNTKCGGGQNCLNGTCLTQNLTQICFPNSVLGCKVCSADGTAWVDNNAKCAGSQTCSNGTCIAPEEDLTPLYAQIATLQQQIADLQRQLAVKTGASAGQTFSCTQIVKNLFYGMTSDSQVKCLQEFLKAQGFFSGAATGSYYTLTKTAVTAFQEKYASEILTPYGLVRGTGSVGVATRTKINQIMGNFH
jgi:hypothetical protein